MTIPDKHALLDFLLTQFPAFIGCWEAKDNDYLDGGEFTAHGLCTVFGGFFAARVEKFDEESLKKLFAFIESAILADPEDESEVANALCTCFLEDIAGEEEGEIALPFMSDATRAYFTQWHSEEEESLDD